MRVDGFAAHLEQIVLTPKMSCRAISIGRCVTRVRFEYSAVCMHGQIHLIGYGQQGLI